MTGIPWLKLVLAGAFTFLISGLLLGTYAYLMAHTELPAGTSIPAAVLWVLGAFGVAVCMGILGFWAVMGVARMVGL